MDAFGSLLGSSCLRGVAAECAPIRYARDVLRADKSIVISAVKCDPSDALGYGMRVAVCSWFRPLAKGGVVLKALHSVLAD